MKTQKEPLSSFVRRLPQTWVQQFFLLGERIKRLPRNKKAMEVLVVLGLGLLIAIPFALWARDTGLCRNCDRHLGFANSGGHLHTCDNCKNAVYICPGFEHEHIQRCDHCSLRLYDCDAVGGPTAAERWTVHRSQDCLRQKPTTDIPKPLPTIFIDR